MQCRHCQEELISLPHVCPVTCEEYDDKQLERFLTSAAIAALTGSTLLGAALGGSLVGGLVGDLIDGDLGD